MIHRSRYPDLAIPEQPVHEFVLSRIRSYGQRPALVDAATGHSVSFDELADSVDRLANGLTARGLRKGDVVALVLPNVVEYPLAYLGIAAAGGVVSTLNPLLTEAELARMLGEGGARFVITVSPLLDKARPAAAAAGVDAVFALGEGSDADSWSCLFSDTAAPRPTIDPASDLVSLPFSSGTSGRPKGVMLTHHNVVAQIVLAEVAGRMPRLATSLVVLPYFHIYGLTVIMLLDLWKGNTQVVMARFDLPSFLEAIQTYRVNMVPVVPPIMLGLAKHPLIAEYDLSSIEVILCGAAPLGSDLEQAVVERLGCRVVQGYGMTELAGASHIMPNDPDVARAGSCGLLLPNLRARIVDPPSGKSLGLGQRGELWINGPVVMQGYLNQSQATAETLVDDGWLRTGDIGYADEDGFFFVVDRLKELIKYKGYQVAPADLEALLISHPAISDAAVIPSPDDEAGEIPKALVVLKSPITEAEIMTFVAERVAPYEKIRRVEVLDTIPKSPSGKILRRVLVERERAAAADPKDRS